MCMQDVKLGRAKSYRSVVVADTASSTRVKIGYGNADRAAYVLTCSIPTTGYTGQGIQVAADSGGLVQVGRLHLYEQRLVLDVESFGQIVTGPLYVVDPANFGIDYWLSELVFDESLESALANQR